MVFQAGHLIESGKVKMFELSRVRESSLSSSNRVDYSIVRNTQTMRKWHTAGIDRGLTVLVRVFYQDSQFLHTELREKERERESRKTTEGEKLTSLWAFPHQFQSHYGHNSKNIKETNKSGWNEAYIWWSDMFFSCISEKENSFACLSDTMIGQIGGWSGGSCIVIQLEWKGLKKCNI